MSDPADHLGISVVDLPPSAESSPEAAVRYLVSHLVQSGLLRPEQADGVVSQVLRRESLGSTNIGRGIAVPHSTSDVGQVLGVVGRAAKPVPWPGLAGSAPVRLVCLLVTPASDPGTSLRALVALSRRLRGD